MVSEGFINHMGSSIESPNQLPQISQRGASAVTWNKYNNNFTMKAGQQVARPIRKKTFYEDEYEKMVLQMVKVEPKREEKTVDPLEELIQLSVLADEGFKNSNRGLTPPITPIWNKRRPLRVSINSVLGWKRYQDEKHDLFMLGIKKLQQQDLERFSYRQMSWTKSIGNFIKARFCLDRKGVCISNGITEMNNKKFKITDKYDEKFLCRHFAEGYCRRGETCDFQHNSLNSRPNSQKVFLGGLPDSMTSHKLVRELKKQGYRVINKPKIIRRFSPQVCLESVDEAQKMLLRRTLTIEGCNVDVRPYEAFTQKELDNQIDINRRSVFLGGLPSDITVRTLKAEIEKLGMKVTNRPIIKAGFIPKVTLATASQAKNLIDRGVLDLNGTAVNVRPYTLSKDRTN